MKACLDGPGLTPTSKRIKEQFENGREYYGLEGRTLRESEQPWAKPSKENHEYHAYSVFR
jgi:putative restriction endonuclease